MGLKQQWKQRALRRQRQRKHLTTHPMKDRPLSAKELAKMNLQPFLAPLPEEVKPEE